jgi:hypothetical protein
MPRIPFDSTAHFTPAQPKCPVCSSPADVYLRKDQTKFEGWCELCGDVPITLEASEKLRSLNKGHVLSRWLATHQHEPELMDLEYVETFLKETPDVPRRSSPKMIPTRVSSCVTRQRPKRSFRWMIVATRGESCVPMKGKYSPPAHSPPHAHCN